MSEKTEDNVLIVKYGEIAVRGNNRKFFIERLLRTIRKNLDDIGDFYVVKEQGRLIVEDRGGELDFDKVIPRILCIMGIIGVSPGVRVRNQELDNLKKVCAEHIRSIGADKYKTFKIETKRSNKSYPLESREVSAAVGEYILDEFPDFTVDVHNPELTVYIELRNDAYVYSELIKGLGGLPVGSSGKGIVMLSGGIDSPVSAFMMAKRGVEVEGVYFNSHIDGRKLFIGPEESMRIQSNLASTIAMAFDECAPAKADRKYIQNSVDRTYRWLERCKKEMARLNSLPDTVNPDQMLFGIDQGGVFNDIRIDHAKRISELDLDGYAVGGLAVGIAQRALDEGIAYTKTRQQFGRPVAKNQGLQFKMADMAIQIECARQLVSHAHKLYELGLPYGKEAAMAKCYAGDMAVQVTLDGIQLFGGYGYSREYPVEKLLRDAKIFQIFEGSNEIQRVVIANNILGKF